MAKAKKIAQFRVTIPTSGIPKQASSTINFVQSFRVYALTTNTGNVYLSDSTVSSASEPIGPGEAVEYDVKNEKDSWYDLTQFYLDTATGGNIVIVTYERYGD